MVLRARRASGAGWTRGERYGYRMDMRVPACVRACVRGFDCVLSEPTCLCHTLGQPFFSKLQAKDLRSHPVASVRRAKERERKTSKMCRNGKFANVSMPNFRDDTSRDLHPPPRSALTPKLLHSFPPTTRTGTDRVSAWQPQRSALSRRHGRSSGSRFRPLWSAREPRASLAPARWVSTAAGVPRGAAVTEGWRGWWPCAPPSAE